MHQRATTSTHSETHGHVPLSWAVLVVSCLLVSLWWGVRAVYAWTQAACWTATGISLNQYTPVRIQDKPWCVCRCVCVCACMRACTHPLHARALRIMDFNSRLEPTYLICSHKSTYPPNLYKIYNVCQNNISWQAMLRPASDLWHHVFLHLPNLGVPICLRSCAAALVWT